MYKLAVSPSPHIKSPRTTTGVMLDVIIALMPALIAANIIFGLRALLVTVVCVLSCVVFEYLARKLMKRENTIRDLSAIVTGLLLAFNLPVTIPLWMAVIGSFVAIVIVKQLFGGLGQNFANPAITARIVLLVSFTGQMTTWAEPFYYQNMAADIATTATPLNSIASGQGLPSLLDMFLGVRGGCMGETCILALLLGGIYLIVRRVITPTLPFCYLGSIAVFSILFGVDPLYELMAGGAMIAAFFMITDYSTSPVTELGKVIFAIGAGLITMVIRVYGSYPEGASFAVLLMNILTPYIEKATRIKPLGGKKMRVARDIVKPTVVIAAIALVVSAALVFTYNLVYGDKDPNAPDEKVMTAIHDTLGTDKTVHVEGDTQALSSEDVPVKTAYTDEAKSAMAVYVTPKGYGGPIDLVVTINKDGTIKQIAVAKNDETPGLGAGVIEDSFTSQYVGKSGELSVVKTGKAGEKEINAIAGATISSKAVTSGVNQALKAFEQLKGALA